MSFKDFLHTYQLELNQQQQQAVQSLDGPVLLLAVPGSGKTTVLVSRIGYMVLDQGIPPENILTMTYTVSAAQDMRRRFAALFGETYAHRLEFRTINGVCSRIISCYERMTGRKAYALMEQGSEQRAIISHLYHQMTQEYATETTVKAIQTAITYAKNQMLRDDELEQVEVEGVEFPALYRKYVQLLRQQQKMDYDDQMVYARQILHRCPPVLRHFQEKYRYICVDEAQDTSKIQHAILTLLAQGSRNLFLVGDEDQSIYGFRAAYPQALLDFQRLYPDARVLYMETNYRSTQQIVTAAQNFIEKNVNRYPKAMVSTGRNGPEIREVQLRDRRSQYEYLVRAVQQSRESLAILYRDNDSAIPLIDLFQRKGIAYNCRQVDCGFFTHRIVRDITAYIEFAANPQDGALFLDLYYKLNAGISRVAATQAAHRCRDEGLSVLEFLSQSTMLSPWSRKRCAALHTYFCKLLHQPAHQAVHCIVNYMGYGKYLEERGGDLRKTEILEALGCYEPSPQALLERLETLNRMIQTGERTPGVGAVTLSTVHSSKGLEYDHVILMDVLDGIFPKTSPVSQGEEGFEIYQEERRLFYVAMTRAKNQLWVLSWKGAGVQVSFVNEVFRRLSRESPDVPQASFERGQTVVHKTYGVGTVIREEGDVLVISFLTAGEKKISQAISTKYGLLRHQ